jgi:hypothetical protein
MIISPTQNYINTLTPENDYTVYLPGISINLEFPRVFSAERNISGTASISIWENTIGGEQRNITVRVPEDVYQKIKRIKNADADEWLMRAQGRIFVVLFDLVGAVFENDFAKNWTCELVILFIEEVF